MCLELDQWLYFKSFSDFFTLGSLGLIIGFSLSSYIAGITLGYKTFKKHFNIVRDKEETKALFFRK